jgi:hypothetical protein
MANLKLSIDTTQHCPKGFPTLPVYTGNVEDQTPHGR